MPELPEVEVVRLGLLAQLERRVVKSLVVRESRLRWPVPAKLPSLVQARRIERLSRRGKYLLMHFEHGVLLVHLGMSGSVNWYSRGAEPALRTHDHLEMAFEHGILRYHDPRRFGSWLWHSAEAGDVNSHPLLAKLGLEPLEGAWDGGVFFGASRGKTLAVKQFLLAGDAVVGVGNIYASEALFVAGIRPTLAAGRISRARYEKLANAVKSILAQAVKHGGSTLRDFVNSSGESGYFQTSHQVYGRAGEPCGGCGTAIRAIRQGQRSTFYCAKCQT